MKYKRAPVIAYLCLLPILLALGVWQLNRAEEKRALIKLQEQRQSTETLLLSATMRGDPEALLYQPAQAMGHYDSNHQYLLDNQVSKGRVGYFVLTPFLLNNATKAVLVNRGWIPLGHTRSDLPDVTVDSRETTIKGHIKRFPSVGLKLAGAEMPSTTWPALIQLVDSQVLANQLGYPLFNFQVELDKDAGNGFEREWHEPLAMPPEKHIAYAVQWFLLALTLTVLFVKYGLKTK